MFVLKDLQTGVTLSELILSVEAKSTAAWLTPVESDIIFKVVLIHKLQHGIWSAAIKDLSWICIKGLESKFSKPLSFVLGGAW